MRLTYTLYFHMINDDVLGIDDVMYELENQVLHNLQNPNHIFTADKGGEVYHFRADKVLYVSLGNEHEVD